MKLDVEVQWDILFNLDSSGDDAEGPAVSQNTSTSPPNVTKELQIFVQSALLLEDRRWRGDYQVDAVRRQVRGHVGTVTQDNLVHGSRESDF